MVLLMVYCCWVFIKSTIVDDRDLVHVFLLPLTSYLLEIFGCLSLSHLHDITVLRVHSACVYLLGVEL